MIVRALAEVPHPFGASAVTIGNFDGVHAGHRHIMRRLVDTAHQHGWIPTVLTFDPHPTRLVAPQRAPRLLSTPDERCETMRELGVQRIVILPFTWDVAALTPGEFVRQILVDKLQARAVLVGEDFRFGHRAAGNTSLLRELGTRYRFETEAMPAVRLRGRVVSSSEIRRLIEAGQVSLACRLLGRPFALRGAVVGGHGVGSKKTVPTLNLEPVSEVMPAVGVYITRAFDPDAGHTWHSITNAGYRPTFGGDRLTVETHLLSPFSGVAPETIALDFLRRLRDERKFESPEALKAQIVKDITRAKAYFRRVTALRPRVLAT